MTGHLVHMGGMGLLTSVLAPLIVLATRQSGLWVRLTLPGLPALLLFVLLHGAITIGMAHWHLPAGGDALLHGVLLAGAVLFWLPVLGPRRLGDAARAVYLFLAAPSLDLAAIYLIIRGDSVGGLAMIVGMLPIGLAAVAVTWQWISEEERKAW